MHEKIFYVYILTNAPFGVFYIGVTSNLPRRIFEHRNKIFSGFTSQYNVTRLVYYEAIDSAEAAMRREKTLKRWPREWKINIINKLNPDWDDLYETLAA